ncbi:hypothetical protein [uncultured Oxalicibacterium sp.]|uniref:hypothetical protein n=1 Tax=uncultured Oxalicibacterium sp. TaxID=1168540 RepID=UPI0025FEF852|nr:hypothetical protein [uncultured Oxalicibacterium sp.]
MAIEGETAREANRADQVDEHTADENGTPKFGRLLLVLAASLLIVVALTFGSLAYYT